MAAPERITIAMGATEQVSGLLQVPPGATACFVMAHGAGAGMTHSFMEAIAKELALQRIATLRFQFPFMERGSRRPDPASVAHSTIRAAVDTAVRTLPELPLITGGRSFGGRMTSQAQAAAELTGVRGLVFIGFPLHPAKRPSAERAQHLAGVALPMLFVQGTRDELAEIPLLEPVCAQLAPRATLHLIDDADHSFHVRRRSGRTDEDVHAEVGQAIVTWIEIVAGPRP
jgi:predicted alpha/beta-hydrolase family hydrolase